MKKHTYAIPFLAAILMVACGPALEDVDLPVDHPACTKDCVDASSVDPDADAGTDPVDPETDADVEPPDAADVPDTGSVDADAGPVTDAGPVVVPPKDFDGDGEPDPRSPVIDASVETRNVLCADGKGTALTYDAITRGSWQFNPGGTVVELGEPGYPCRAFLHDAMRPAPADVRWTDAKDRDFVGFNEVSTVTAMGYRTAQFRYFRTSVFVPSGWRGVLTVRAMHVDDSLHVVVYNPAHPNGMSPTDAGPSEMGVGACTGNGSAVWNLSSHVMPGEVNTILLVHADLSPATSTLASVEVEADGLPIQMVNCGS